MVPELDLGLEFVLDLGLRLPRGGIGNTPPRDFFLGLPDDALPPQARFRLRGNGGLNVRGLRGLLTDPDEFVPFGVLVLVAGVLCGVVRLDPSVVQRPGDPDPVAERSRG